MTQQLYGDSFFDLHEQGARASARAAIPEVFHFVHPASVVDVGCGVGQWLVEFKAAGVNDYLGIDGDYVNRQRLLIEPERFLPKDLSQPLAIDRRFDLAVSLEVAEHLPESSAADFVASLVRLAPVVLFSAAIPYQWGDGHVNEQWPEYWREKFLQCGYVVADCLRRRLWDKADVKHWYCQNLFFYVDRTRINEYPQLARVVRREGEGPPLSLVHPTQYLNVVQHLIKQFRESQRAAARGGLQLREINLVAFPNWSLPPEHIRAQLRSLMTAAVAHPQAGRMTLVIDITNQRHEFPAQLTREAIGQYITPGGVQRPGTPNVAAVTGNFEAEQWDILRSCLQLRIALPDENPTALVASGAIELPAISLDALLRRQPLCP
jgi:SAM-dependent methyltransferase